MATGLLEICTTSDFRSRATVAYAVKHRVALSTVFGPSISRLKGELHAFPALNFATGGIANRSRTGGTEFSMCFHLRVMWEEVRNVSVRLSSSGGWVQ